MARTVLVVDDAEVIRKTVALVLQKEGYEIIEATNGEDALGKLKENKIDLIICDVNMPKLDGLAFLKTITNDTAYSDYKFTPVLMLTTEASEQKMGEGLKLGVKSWMLKPFRPDELLKSVKVLVP